MAYENIRFNSSNLAVYDTYFWMIDDVLDILIMKTDDGTQAFTYPLDHSIEDGKVKNIEYDGYNLWTLENLEGNDLRIRKWYINNYIVKLDKTFDLVESDTDKFDSETMAVESYTVKFSSDEDSGEQNLSIGDQSNGDICSKIESGDEVILGPNKNGKVEKFTVSSAGSDYVVINGTTDFPYEAGDSVRFTKNIWLFNNYHGEDDSVGALYRISPYTGSIKDKIADNAYKNIKASTFYGVPYFVFNGGTSTEHPRDFSIIYIKATNMIFLNPEDPETAFGSLVMDNVEDDLASVIDIYDVSVDNKNIYRLQRKATYYGATSSFDDDTYNYQLSTLNSLINSISLNADPAILPANGDSVSDIKAIVKDQFNQPVVGKSVAFTCDDDDGQILSEYVNTDSDGVATTGYQAGVEAREVRITATAQQG